MFLGTFRSKILSNWQIILPSGIRASLGSNRAIITTGFEKCIYGFSVAEWEKIGASELVKPLSTLEGRKVRQRMFAEALEVDLDDQGRFVIAEYLREYAGIRESAAVVGTGDHFEIWDEREWEKIKRSL